MNNILEKIIELSDHLWIQKRWEPKVGGWVKTDNGIGVITVIGELVGDYRLEYSDNEWEWITIEGIGNSYDKQVNPIWLPVGFNPETGNWQIDDLLMEILKSKRRMKYQKYMSFAEFLYRSFETWRNEKIYGNHILTDNVPLEQQKYFFNQNEVISKLIWLCELIK